MTPIHSDTTASLPAGFHCQETKDRLTGKLLRTYRHTCGLLVKVLPRPGFSRRFAAVTIPYGSIHTTFTDGRQTWHVPAGTAHFLEHCIFSRDDGGGLLGRLSELGASANAYTTHSHTMYYFSTVHHFDEALELYLDAILQPYLGEDRIEAERPVILSELDQYMDDPDTRCYMQLMENLYANHPGSRRHRRNCGIGQGNHQWGSAKCLAPILSPLHDFVDFGR
jgi:predicted Zn-dependent peptidase